MVRNATERWLVAFVVMVSISFVTFTAIWVPSHQQRDRMATPEEIAAYEAAACRAAWNGLPRPEPLYVGNGKWMSVSCDGNV
jgi:hypothetical protein